MQAMSIIQKKALATHLDFPVEHIAKLAEIISYSNTVVATHNPNAFAASTQQTPTTPLYNEPSTRKNQSINNTKSNKLIENTHSLHSRSKTESLSLSSLLCNIMQTLDSMARGQKANDIEPTSRTKSPEQPLGAIFAFAESPN